MTVVLDGTPASWWARAGAFGLDVIVGVGVLATALLVGASAPLRTWLWWLCMVIAAAVFLAVAVNRWLLPSIFGWSVGRSVFGIEVVSRHGIALSPWRLALRDLAHLLDTAPLLLGWLWPLVDSHGRTLADILIRTEVHRGPPRSAERRPLARLAVAVAALIALAVAGLGYLSSYRPEAAVAATRGQIVEQGPKIVTDVLSYTTATINDDFARAQSLVTDSYRPKLVEQQDAVRKAGPVDNDYWVSNSALVPSSSTADGAALLLLLQGQRGAGQSQRFISASVRAIFEKSRSGQWRLSDLLVLAPPKVAEGKR